MNIPRPVSPLLLILLLVRHRRPRNPIQVPHPALRDPSAPLTPFLIHLHHPQLFERLHDLPVHRPARVAVVRRPRPPVLGAAVDLPEAPDADGLAQVDVAGYGGGTDVEPVRGLGGELVAVRGFDGVDPA